MFTINKEKIENKFFYLNEILSSVESLIGVGGSWLTGLEKLQTDLLRCEMDFQKEVMSLERDNLNWGSDNVEYQKTINERFRNIVLSQNTVNNMNLIYDQVLKLTPDVTAVHELVNKYNNEIIIF